MAQPVFLQERRATWEGMSNFCLQGIESEIGQGHDFKFRCNGKIFIVAISPAGPPNDKIRSVLSKYNNACSKDDDEEEYEVQEEIEDMIYQCAWQAFAPLAPSVTSPEFPSDLHTHLNPENFLLSPRHGWRGSRACTRKCTTTNATVSPHDFRYVKYKEIFTKVLVNEQEACCKIGTDTHGPAIQREYKSLHTISLFKCADSIRVPKLIGLVVDDDGIIGILEEFVPSEHTLGKILGGSAAPDGDRRKKWGQQIEQTLYDAWLIDSGGSFTEGWVDMELKETLAGDEQALKRITQALDT
ncbi:hypothetical protein O988_00633 [Pseudogymnoascus sp. VKM F-3808]|nr:hypothetical protein O988_00633 [Pseudogymnoascus sp. VKM F-3808]